MVEMLLCEAAFTFQPVEPEWGRPQLGSQPSIIIFHSSDPDALLTVSPIFYSAGIYLCYIGL
jgi:hypothetical protein